MKAINAAAPLQAGGFRVLRLPECVPLVQHDGWLRHGRDKRLRSGGFGRRLRRYHCNEQSEWCYGTILFTPTPPSSAGAVVNAVDWACLWGPLIRSLCRPAAAVLSPKL